MTVNRELSQFVSFVDVDDSTKYVSIATTTSISRLGVNTISPQSSAHVVGDVRIDGSVNTSGIVTALRYYGDGSTLTGIENIWITNSVGVHTTKSVGIGTTNPTSTLTVSGNSLTTGIATASRFVSTVSSGTAPFTISSNTLITNLNADFLRGKLPPTGDLVGTTDIQTLSNKTLSSPSITTPTVSSGGANFSGSTGITTLKASTTATGVITLPAETGTLVSTGSNSVVTSTMIVDGTITNSDISATAAIAITKLASSTISGISLGNNLNALTFGSYLNGGSYNGSSAVTVSVAATTLNTANTVVSRNASGDFTAGTVSVANIVASGDIADGKGNVRSLPQNSQTSGYTLILSDRGKHISITSGGVTVPQAIFSAGDVITIYNNSSSPQSIFEAGPVNLRLAGTTTLGTRTLAEYGVATILCISNNQFVVYGNGIS